MFRSPPPGSSGADTRSRRSTLIATVVLALIAASLSLTPSRADAALTYRLGDTVTFEHGAAASDVKVDLFISRNGQRAGFIANTATDGSGNYGFDVPNGCYAVVFAAPGGTSFARDADDPWEERHICMGNRNRLYIDATLYGPAEPQRIGDQVMFIDGDIAHNVGDMKIDLFGSLNGRRDGFIATTSTNALGQYSFEVDDGCYGVVFAAPAAMTFTPDSDDPWHEHHTCLDGGSDLDVDATLYPAMSVDAIVSGQALLLASDVLEFARDLRVNLFHSTGNQRDGFIGSAQTDRFGQYSFDVDSGCYAVVLRALDGYTFTPGAADQWDEQHGCTDAAGRLSFGSRLFPEGSGPSDPACFRRVFRDDFNGTELDLANWYPYDADPGNAGFGVRNPDSITVADGKLNIEASMRADNRLHTGGMKHTSYGQRYGYYEVRVRVDPDPDSATAGVVLTWPLNNDNPAGGENNIFETHETINGQPSGDADRKPVKSFMHYPDPNEADGDSAVSRTHYGSDGTVWAVYAMEWTPGKIVYLHNGQPSADGPVTGDIIPTHQHNLTIQLDAWRNQMSSTVNMEVDYVEVWDYTCEPEFQN